jgi:hypothetical protein
MGVLPFIKKWYYPLIILPISSVLIKIYFFWSDLNDFVHDLGQRQLSTCVVNGMGKC